MVIQDAEGEMITPEEQDDIGNEISAGGSDLKSGERKENSNINPQEQKETDNVVQFQPKETWKDRLSKVIEDKYGQISK